MNECNLIYKFTGLTQTEILNLPLDMYMLNLKNAFIHDKMKTEEGREYLKTAYRLKVTEPDYEKLKKLSSYKKE